MEKVINSESVTVVNNGFMIEGLQYNPIFQTASGIMMCCGDWKSEDVNVPEGWKHYILIGPNPSKEEVLKSVKADIKEYGVRDFHKLSNSMCVRNLLIEGECDGLCNVEWDD